MTTCSCGRPWNHCRVCGAKNIYRLINQSELESARNGRQIDVWRCKRCMSATSELTQCQASKDDKDIAEYESKKKSITELSELTDEELIRKFQNEGGTAQDLIEALRRRGHKVNLVPETEPATTQSDPEEKVVLSEEEIKRGWTLDSEGRPIAPDAFSLDKLIDSSKDKE